jgi:hypothetical protein
MARRRGFNHRFTRRGFLASAGLSVAATPFVPLLEPQAADGLPLRLILLFSPNGTIHERWAPTGTESEFTLGEILMPLEANHQGNIIVLDGIDYNSGGAGNNHMAGPSRFTAGSGLLAGSEFSGGGDASSGWGAGKSIDQEYADVAGLETPFRSLELGVRITSTNPRTRMAYSGPDQPIAPEVDPTAVFDRLFTEFTQSAEEVERIRAQRRSVIDVVKAQTDALEQQVGLADKLKIEAHLHGIREIEKRLDSGLGSCDVPMLGDPLDHLDTDNYPAVSRLMIDLMVMAMACDLTRAATFMWSGSTSGQTFPWLGITTGHHDISHEGDSNGGAIDDLVAINTWYAGEFAYLLDRLAETPEGDSTMLDHTIVLWGNELGRGNSHTRTTIPLVMAGGGAAGFVTGRYLQLDGVANNRVLVSILNALGIEVDTWGTTDNGTGGLAGL